MDPQQQRTFALLFVCTGNVCRSPTAEALLRRRLIDGGWSDSLTVASAGVGTENGWRIDPTIAEMLDKRGIVKLGNFRSRALSDQIIAGADLILTGTRDHRLKIGKSWPDAYSRTFTLREAAFLLSDIPEDVRAALPTDLIQRSETVLSWLQAERGLVATPEDQLDINDPIGGRARVYRRMVEEVSAAVDIVADVLVPATP